MSSITSFTRFDSTSIRSALRDICQVDEKYIVPLDGADFIPQASNNETVGTWIGFRILQKRPYTRAYTQNDTMIVPIQTTVRVSFVGPNAETLADGTLFWDVRDDVNEILARYSMKLMYTQRDIFTTPMHRQGANDTLAYTTDIRFQGFSGMKIHWDYWFEGGNR